jgi:hypothetical protein
MEKEEIESRLIAHKIEIKEYLRKKRKDVGLKRESYKMILPVKYRNYMMRANAKGLKFDISIEEFNDIIEKDCNYCGSNLSVSVDRIISKMGYIKTNIQPLCSKCNMMKYVYSEEDFLKHVARIYLFRENLK